MGLDHVRVSVDPARCEDRPAAVDAGTCHGSGSAHRVDGRDCATRDADLAGHETFLVTLELLASRGWKESKGHTYVGENDCASRHRTKLQAQAQPRVAPAKPAAERHAGCHTGSHAHSSERDPAGKTHDAPDSRARGAVLMLC